MGSRQVPSERHASEHLLAAQSTPFLPASTDLVHVGSRRWFLQTGLAGLAGLSVPSWLRLRAHATGKPATQKTSVILFWLSGDQAIWTCGIRSLMRQVRFGDPSARFQQVFREFRSASTFRSRPGSWT